MNDDSCDCPSCAAGPKSDVEYEIVDAPKRLIEDASAEEPLSEAEGEFLPPPQVAERERAAFLRGAAIHAYLVNCPQHDDSAAVQIAPSADFEVTRYMRDRDKEVLRTLATKLFPITEAQFVPNHADIETEHGRVIYTMLDDGRLSAKNLRGNFEAVIETVAPEVLGPEGLRKLADLLDNPRVLRTITR